MHNKTRKILEYLKTAQSAGIPAFFLAGALVIRALFPEMPKLGFLMIHYFFFIASVVAVLLSWWFNRTKALFVSVICLVGYLLVYLKLGHGLPNDDYGTIFFPAFCFLAPLNIVVFSCLDERGLLTFKGMLRILSLIIQAGGAFFISFSMTAEAGSTKLVSFGQSLNDFLYFRVFEEDLFATPVTQVALCSFVFSFLFFIIKSAVTGKPMDCGFLTVVITLFFGVHFVGDRVPAEFFLASVLVILAAIIQDSYNMAFNDHLTGIPGRQALVADLKKLGSRYTIAMADIDFFKKFNDTYGHDVGDQVLRMVASNLRTVGGNGKAYRYGGEEFTILFSGKGKTESREFLEEVRKRIEDTAFRLRSKDRDKNKKDSVQVTVSIGVAEKGRVDADVEDVLKKADEALYKAKKNGRNCVVIS